VSRGSYATLTAAKIAKPGESSRNLSYHGICLFCTNRCLQKLFNGLKLQTYLKKDFGVPKMPIIVLFKTQFSSKLNNAVIKMCFFVFKMTLNQPIQLKLTLK